MTNSATNLRKAAVLLRSLDADTATAMLAQLSTDEAAAIRGAVRSLGPIHPEEQAAVVAEFRQARPQSTASSNGVELELSQATRADQPGEYLPSHVTAKRFEFLQGAPMRALIPYLAREQAQTIAVVLSHLAPSRAAEVLAALPARLQTETIERLSGIGEMDAESVSALERELAIWVAKRDGGRTERAKGGATVAAILAAADVKTRDRILLNLESQESGLARRFPAVAIDREEGRQGDKETRRDVSIKREIGAKSAPEMRARSNPADPAAKENASAVREQTAPMGSSPQPRRSESQPLPRIDFDQLIHLDNRTLAVVLRDMDANVLALALVGSQEDLIDRICDQMPKRTARDFRRELRRIGPTRLSDVEAAQRAVAAFAAQHLARRRRSSAAAIC